MIISYCPFYPHAPAKSRSGTPPRAAAALLRELPQVSPECRGRSRRSAAAALRGVLPRVSKERPGEPLDLARALAIATTILVALHPDAAVNHALLRVAQTTAGGEEDIGLLHHRGGVERLHRVGALAP